LIRMLWVHYPLPSLRPLRLTAVPQHDRSIRPFYGTYDGTCSRDRMVFYIHCSLTYDTGDKKRKGGYVSVPFLVFLLKWPLQ
jgi:hypothetical protein